MTGEKEPVDLAGVAAMNNGIELQHHEVIAATGESATFALPSPELPEFVSGVAEAVAAFVSSAVASSQVATPPHIAAAVSSSVSVQ